MEIHNAYGYGSHHSIVHGIKSRELNASKGRKRPFMFTYSSSSTETQNEDLPSSSSSSSRAIASSHDGFSTPPLAVSFAKTIKNAHILSVTDEEGYVSLYNTRVKLEPLSTDQENADKAIVTKWVAHENAVYDVCWIKDDATVLTASGDHTIKLWDVEQKKCTGLLSGHQASVKCISSHPTNSDLIVSGSRDGSFALWDLRCTTSQGTKAAMLQQLVDRAHTSVKRRRPVKGKVNTIAVTSVLHLKDEVSIATGGAIDSIIKFWDTRNLRAPAAQASPLHESTETNARHGITSLSQDDSGVMLSASCRDNRIYLYNVVQLQKGPISSFSGSEIGSFFVKSAISPDASHILSGSGDGNAYIWQVNSPHNDPIALAFHEKEVTAVDWSPHELGKIATASDDFTVRFWNIKNRYSPPPKSLVRKRVMAVPSTENIEPSVEKRSPSSSGNNEIATEEQSLAVEMRTPEITPHQKPKRRLLSGVNLTEAFEKTPEAAVWSPSSVLTPPSSTKKRTIRDYFLV